MTFAELPAKSARGSTPLSLEQHLLDTERAAALLFSADHRIGQNFRRFFQIPEHEHPRFLLHVRIAGLLHDLGKANEGFVRAVRGHRDAQVLRHEHLSALVLHQPAMRNWLNHNPAIDWDLVTAAVLVHHLKAGDPGRQDQSPGWGQPLGEVRRVPIYLFGKSAGESAGEPVNRVWGRLAELAKLPPPPPIALTDWNFDEWTRVLEEGCESNDKLVSDIQKNHLRAGLLAAAKAGVIAADSVASGLFRIQEELPHWLTALFQQPEITKDEVFAKIIKPRLASISRRSGQKKNLLPFQTALAEQGERVLLLAGCGMGKTLAAWSWAAAQASVRRFGKVIFLYPTRGTATEGFRDYVGWAPETEASLVHGSAQVELRELLQNPSESTEGKQYETDARLFALGLWSRRFFSATVDQFLGFLEHQYGSLCLLPALADSVVIVDEVHSFDPHMFELLLAFLQRLDVPVLCMTATLPKTRQNALIDRAKLSLFPPPAAGSASPSVAALLEAESVPRYRHVPLTDKEAALTVAVSAFQNRQRVLWVVNTVDRCQALARELSRQTAQTVLCYHSRFTLDHRRKRHDATVSAFAWTQGICESGGVLAVTTQVCEMSLDLDADVLITEVAPVSSLVQRFGRANRHGRKGPDFRATLHTYQPPCVRPYDREELQAAEKFLSALSENDITPKELAEKLVQHSPNDLPMGDFAPFLSQGYFALPGKFRDGDGYTVSGVLSGDLSKAERLVRDRECLEGLVLPIPRLSPALVTTPRPAFLPSHLQVCDSGFYDPNFGLLSKRAT